MDKFYIDRQFGNPIWIDVENGIVLRCYGETEKFDNRMNELYVGKSINFLNEDFIGRAMKGTYHHLRPDTITTVLRQVENFKARIKHLWNEYSSINTSKERQYEIKGQIKEVERQLYEVQQKLKTEKERITKEHGFEWKSQSEFKNIKS
jgi:hypothetical protein